MGLKTSSGILARVKAANLVVDGKPASPEANSTFRTGSAMGGTLGGGAAGSVGGGATGALLGLILANRTQDQGWRRKAKQGLGVGLGGAAGALAGGVGGAVGGAGLGMGLGDGVTGGIKQADALGDAFGGAVDDAGSTLLQTQGLRDVRNLGLAGLGVGAAGRGLVGLIQLLKSNKPKKMRSGPAELSLPYPAEAEEKAGFDIAGFLGGNSATTKAGIPWYGPAMLGGAALGLGAGWKGMDAVLDARRKREMDGQLDSARQEFHDALMSQYDEPQKVDHRNVSGTKKAADATMAAVGAGLDALFTKVAAVLDDPGVEKAALELPSMANAAGVGAGAYGMYAGLSGLMAGALMYNKTNKRSRRAILESALKKRQRRQFMQRPTEITAVPEPVAPPALAADPMGD